MKDVGSPSRSRNRQWLEELQNEFHQLWEADQKTKDKNQAEESAKTPPLQKALGTMTQTSNRPACSTSLVKGLSDRSELRPMTSSTMTMSESLTDSNSSMQVLAMSFYQQISSWLTSIWIEWWRQCLNEGNKTTRQPAKYKPRTSTTTWLAKSQKPKSKTKRHWILVRSYMSDWVRSEETSRNRDKRKIQETIWVHLPVSATL